MKTQQGLRIHLGSADIEERRGGGHPPAFLGPRPALTRSTEPRTTSDTLCRSSAAVPGLLSARVNFRVSADAGSSDSCDILAAAAPEPAVRPGRSAAR